MNIKRYFIICFFILTSFQAFPQAINWDGDYPTDTSKYLTRWHTPPVSQGKTGTCWSFATVSMLESEVYRKTGNRIKLSEMYIVYWEYVERAKAYVRARGDVYFAQGSEATGVIRMMQNYGMVTHSAYPGKTQEIHDHTMMFHEMDNFLKTVRETDNWNIEMVTSTIRGILDHYLGTPPEKFKYKESYYPPLDFVDKVLQLKTTDYFSFMSTLKMPYNQRGELVEADNWWHCDDYYNVSIDDFYFIMKNALKEGYTISLCGDVSEPGFDGQREVGIIPVFDIPQDQINKESREFRLNNLSTTDDHCMHVVGYLETGGRGWFLVKDSGSGAFAGPNKGYRFIRDDYIRLKMMNIMVCKEAARMVLDKIIK